MDNVKVTKEALLEQIRKVVNIQRLNELVEYIVDEVSEKNVAYGGAWQLYAILTSLIHIREKLVRTENVSMRNGAMIVTVKFCDDLLKELMDAIGYSMLAMLWVDANMDISIDKAVNICKQVADAHIEDNAYTKKVNLGDVFPIAKWNDNTDNITVDWRKNLPDCPFEVRIMEKECKENDDEKVSMFFPVTIGEDGKYEVKAEDLMNAAIEMFDNNLRVKWDGLLPKGWHSVDDANVTG